MLVFMCISVTTFAQAQISGRVTNAKDDTPAAGVTVTVKGTRTAVKTDADGAFTIMAPAASSMLEFTSVGFVSQQATATNGTLNISLTASTAQLQDVVVVAYGTRRKSDLTGSVVAVGQKDFQKGVINSSEQLIQGKVPGLEVTTGGGSAGGGSKIRIRSGASLNASNDPLIVVDNVPIEGNGVAGSANYLNTINPNDIESISVLKDASATALYGSRASNGVIIITTKKGAGGKVVFNFNTRVSQSEVRDYVDVLTGDEVRSTIKGTGMASYINQLGTQNTNWQDAIYQKAIGIDNNLSASGTIGKNDFKLPFRASAGYLTQEGILRTNNFDRMTGSLNLSPKLFTDHLSINLTTRVASTKTRFADEGAIGSALSFDPTQSIYSGSKGFGGYTEYLSGGLPNTLSPKNPLALLEMRKNIGHVDRFLGNVQLDYKLHFFPDLHLQANFGIDDAKSFGTDIRDSAAAVGYDPIKKGNYSTYKQHKKNTLAEVSLFYSKEIKSIRSKFDLLALHGYQDFETRIDNFSSYFGSGLINPDSRPAFPYDIPENNLESYLGRLNYSFADKYLLTASFRRDASSRFSKENRKADFPAVAVAWKLKEDFFRSSKAVNELKLRASWGKTGNQEIGSNYSYLPYYQRSTISAQYQFGDIFYNFLRPSAYDRTRKWEKMETKNIGLDYAFFSSRISGTVDVYQKNSTDMLNNIPVAPGSNFDITLLTNIGSMENKGIEASLNIIPVRSKSIIWEIGVNGSYSTSKVTKLLKFSDPTFKGYEVNTIAGGTGNNVSLIAVGNDPYVFWLYKQIYDGAGNPIEGLYEDMNRDGVIDANDRVKSKSSLPKYLFGATTSFSYKKWVLSAAAHGSAGNYLYNNYNSNNGSLISVKNNLGYIANAGANYLKTKFTVPQYLSDYYVENASYIRIDNINLGYNFGRINNSHVALRLSASVQNVALITKYSGIDPESANTGVDNTIYPRPRIYSLGASLDF